MRRITSYLLVCALGVTGCAGTPQDERAGHTDPAEINAQLGIGYMRDGNNEVALKKFERALEINPDLVQAHIGIAVLYERLGKLDKASEHYQEAVDLDPDNPRAHNNYGNFLCDRGRIDQAIEQFREAANNPLYDNTAVAWFNAGACASRAEGRGEEAEKYFRKALQEDPEFARALLSMARLSYEKEHYLQARGFLQRYQAVADHTPQSLWLRVRVERALGNGDVAASHTLLLRNQFPDSDEAAALRDSNGSDDGR